MEDIIVIGSGVGGSTVFKELKEAFPDQNIRLIESGSDPFYVSEGENVEVIYANSFGGTGVYSVANAVRIDLKEFNISKKDPIYEKIEKELSISDVPDDYLRKNSKKLLESGFSKTPKFINFELCKNCGLCAHDPCDAKWIPCDFLRKYNDDIVTDTIVMKLAKQDGIFSIVALDKKSGEIRIYRSKQVIVSAGAINSPRILKTILNNEEIGKNLYIDTFVTVGGILKDSKLKSEVSMAINKKYDDFILATHYSELLHKRISEFEEVNKNDVFGLMVKIKDENTGEVFENSVKKEMSMNDTRTLCEGVSKASKYLYNLGIENIYSTVPRGSHPGGTCAVGKVVNKNLETEIEGLYVCDASVIPKAPGAPPILGIMAISNKFVENLKK
ncbi:GMC oxidoreductase [Methanococcus maripaludis]|uniref:Choline dehydrogenase n=1 Tax=Methanococcus maripaludis TaxID=39152 RepID=A0A2L1C9L4_METMI|nr:GMC oxidoreductase [Methanococcus maripaludis]AVB76044.1 choline dehydrogenase [Methanococcus maripaludis]MBA2864504.1 choline dehydrogenase-like flavoprotein [Methanococcus maripaludis]MBB6497354.1 choline dehydrogenase-like flavoprotein [Methanococcus maripaludis]